MVLSYWSRSFHLNLDTRLAADGYMGNIVTIKAFGIRTVVFSVQAWNTFVVAETFPILILLVTESLGSHLLVFLGYALLLSESSIAVH